MVMFTHAFVLGNFTQPPYRTTGLSQQLGGTGQEPTCMLNTESHSMSTFITGLHKHVSVILTSRKVRPGSTTLSSHVKHSICVKVIHRRDRAKRRQ